MLPCRETLIIAGLIAAILMCYAQVRDHDFINYDDHRYITRNDRVQQGLTVENVVWALTTFEVANWHPLTWLSHMMDCDMFRRDDGSQWPGGHHLMNVVFHVANTIILFLLLMRMTGATWRSALVAALFALHPLHVESVAWVSERKDVLSTFFGLLAIAAYVRYISRQSWRTYSVVVVLFAMSLMSKPMLVTLPFAFLLLDYWPLRRFEISQLKSRPVIRLVIEKIPLIVLSLIASSMTLMAQTQGGAVSGLDVVPLTGRIANAVVANGMYIWQTIRPMDLLPFYPLPESWPLWMVLLSAVVVTAITVTAVLLIRKCPHLIVGWLWFLGTLVPVIGLVQVGSQAHADRYTYVPLIGLFIMVAWSLPTPRNERMKMTCGVVAAIVLIALSALSFVQIRLWRDSITLSTYALNVRSDNGVIHFNLANALIEIGETEQAIAHFKSATNLMPGWPDIPFNLGNTYRRLGRFDEAIAAYDQSLLRKSTFVPAIINRAIALSQLGEKSRAIDSLHHALTIEPLNVDAHRTLGQFMAEINQPEKAIDHFYTVLAIRPNDAVTHLLLGSTLATIDRLDEAMVHLERSLQLNPNEPRAHMSMAAALIETGHRDLALQHLRIAADLAVQMGKPEMVAEIQRRIERFGLTLNP